MERVGAHVHLCFDAFFALQKTDKCITSSSKNSTKAVTKKACVTHVCECKSGRDDQGVRAAKAQHHVIHTLSSSVILDEKHCSAQGDTSRVRKSAIFQMCLYNIEEIISLTLLEELIHIPTCCWGRFSRMRYQHHRLCSNLCCNRSKT